jgi:hypothetical protein
MRATSTGLVELHFAWPPLVKTEVFQSHINGWIYKLEATKDGRFDVTFSLGENKVNFLSQRIEFTKYPRFVLTVIKDEGQIRLRIHGVEVLSSDTKEVLLIKTKEKFEGSCESFDDPSADESCKEWVNWRTAWFGSIVPINRGERRALTEAEELHEFIQAKEALNDLTIRFAEGDAKYGPIILSQFRSLLFWPDNEGSKGKYNPLLLRIAARHKLPLPVYAFKSEDLTAAVGSDVPSSRVENNTPSIKQQFATQPLIDFQEWLDSNSLEYRRKNYSIKNLIFELANTGSAAHYDQNVPIVKDDLTNNRSFGADNLTRFIVETGQITTYVADKLVERIVEIEAIKNEGSDEY